jgi:3-hydroxyacyl-CoA dehydrogenase
MTKTINNVSILGSGVMGSRIACHFANIGVSVLLLDIAPDKLNEQEIAQGLDIESPSVKNRIVNNALKFALKSSPSPLYEASSANKITTGNFTEDMPKISKSDWIIEVVVENLEIKKKHL